MINFQLDFYTKNKIFNTLFIILLFTFLMWLVQYHWKRRKMYRLASAVPGPLVLPLIGSAWYFGRTNTDVYNAVTKLGKSYTSPVKIWLGNLLFIAVWGANDLEVTMNSPYALGKHDVYKFFEPVSGTGVFTAPIKKWKRNRKIIMPTFNQKILDGFVEIFSETSEILVQQLKKEVGNGFFDVMTYVSRCSMDLFCESAMGTKVYEQTKTDSLLWKSVNRAQEICFARIFNIFLHPDFIFNLTPMSKELSEIIKVTKSFGKNIVQQKKLEYQKKVKEARESPEAFLEDTSNKRKPFIELLIELSENGANFTNEELADEVYTFLIAATDTTSLEVCFTLLMLGMHPDIQQKVYEEVIDVLGSDRPVGIEDFAKFTYMERVIKETLRLFPAGPLLVRKVEQDIKLETCTIPAGGAVAFLIMNTHRDPEIWPDPLKFDPDRFLPDEVAKRHPYSWIPFSGGPRNCMGPKFAYMAMKTMLATLVRKYYFSTNYKSVEDIALKIDLVLKAADGYNVSIQLRD